MLIQKHAHMHACIAIFRVYAWQNFKRTILALEYFPSFWRPKLGFISLSCQLSFLHFRQRSLKVFIFIFPIRLQEWESLKFQWEQKMHRKNIFLWDNMGQPFYELLGTHTSDFSQSKTHTRLMSLSIITFVKYMPRTTKRNPCNNLFWNL